jgi:hypothetical protein
MSENWTESSFQTREPFTLESVVYSGGEMIRSNYGYGTSGYGLHAPRWKHGYKGFWMLRADVMWEVEASPKGWALSRNGVLVGVFITLKAAKGEAK